ncbi:MAG: class I SAM-dependent methyltransferase [Acidimicrobiia bacterium]|nr:class I SAM-dependent methyltransferase [Acidimicrobiia bacterium]
MTTANEAQREYWNRDDARHWVDQQARYDEMLEPFGAAMLDAAGITSGEHVLDVGCGNGVTTRSAARSTVDGRALGVDLSEAMLERARALALKEGVANVSFDADDAQTRQFTPEFDVAISRFGVMFFDDPAAAFANIRSGLRPGGRGAFIVWQALPANEWMAVPGAAILEYVDPPDGDPTAPGPYALADPDRVRSIFDTAGFRDLSIDAFTAPMLVGGRGTLDDATTFMRNSGIARAMLDDKPANLQERAIAAVREALKPHLTDEGVQLGGATWLVTATSS